MPDMNCTEFEARLREAVEARRSLDEEAPDWQELRAHAGLCPDCRRLWNEFALLERVLPIWKEGVPPVNLAEAVLIRWREEQTTAAPAANGRKNSGWNSFFAVALAAAVAVLASVPIWFSPEPEGDLPEGTFPVADALPEQPVDANVRAPEPANFESQPKVDWQVLAQDAGSAYWVLASDTADAIASVTVLVPPRKAPAEPPVPVEPRPASRWGVTEIGTGLKPIGQDVSRAMDFLFEALPSDRPTL